MKAHYTGPLLALGMMAWALTGLEESYMVDLQIYGRYESERNKGTLEIQARDVGKPLFPEGTVWNLSISPVEFFVDWKAPSLMMVESARGEIKEKAAFTKGVMKPRRMDLPQGLYIVTLTFDPAQQTDIAVLKAMGSGIKKHSFHQVQFLGDVGTVISERELLLAEWEKFLSLLERIEKSAMTDKDWNSRRAEFVKEADRLVQEMIIVKKLSWFGGSAGVLKNSVHDLLNYAANLDKKDLSDEKYGGGAQEKDKKYPAADKQNAPAVEGGLKSSYGERLSFRQLKANADKGMALIAREQGIYILYEAANALGVIGDEASGSRPDRVEAMKDTEDGLLSFREEMSKTKLSAVYNDLFSHDKLGDSWDRFAKDFQKIVSQFEKGPGGASLQKEILLLRSYIPELEEKFLGAK